MNGLNRFLNILFTLLLVVVDESLSSFVNHYDNDNDDCQDITQLYETIPYLSSTSRFSLRGDLLLPIPPHAKKGDLLMLFLSRTDDVLPIQLHGWSTGPSCLKEHNKGNHLKKCWQAGDCLNTTTTSDGITYCTRFPYNQTGQDLATVVFYKPVEEEELRRDVTWLTVNLAGRHPAWATLAAISKVNMTHPIRSSAGVSCDRKAAGVFPKVYGKAGDLLLLSMAHDDPTNDTAFQAPKGTQLVRTQHGVDEAGYLFARRLNVTGKTLNYATIGEGTQWWCKDALLSMVIRMLPSDTTNATENDLFILDETDPHCREGFRYSSILSNLFAGLWNFWQQLQASNCIWRLFG